MIPTRHDGELAEIENLAAGIMTQLRTLQHAGARDVPRMSAALRDALQNYVDRVMATARDQ